MELDIKTVTGGPLDVNTYVVGASGSNQCVLIDPGAEYAAVNGAVCGREVKAVLLTHAHFDHMLYARPWLKDGVKLYVHKLDAPALADPSLNLSGVVGAQLTLPDADVLLEEGDCVEEADIRFDVLHTPGHTPGSVCYRAGDVLFTGDTLFRHECGRCDLEGGDFSAMLRSLKRLSELEGDYKVLPGHEGISTLDEERAANPYMLQANGR